MANGRMVWADIVMPNLGLFHGTFKQMGADGRARPLSGAVRRRLFFARNRAGGPLDDEPVDLVLERKGAQARAIAKLQLGLVNAAKLHLRPDRPFPSDGPLEAKRLLKQAADGGGRHGANMLAVLEKKPPP